MQSYQHLAAPSPSTKRVRLSSFSELLQQARAMYSPLYLWRRKPWLKRLHPLELRQFLMRKQDDEDTDAPMERVPAKASTLLPVGAYPACLLLARTQSRGRTMDQGDGAQRSTSRGEDKERPKPVGVLSSYFGQVAAFKEEAMELDRQEDVMPTDFTSPKLLGDFLDWTVKDLTRSWDEGEIVWFNMHVGLYLYEPDDQWTTCHPRCFAACSASRDRALPERFCCWSCYIDGGNQDILKSSWPSMCVFTRH